VEFLQTLLSLPVVQVLLGAFISAWVALAVAKKAASSETRRAKLDFLTRIDRDLLEMLKVFEPLPYHVDDDGKLQQGPGQLDNFARIRSMYFRHSTLIDPDAREVLDLSFARAEAAYLLLLAPKEPLEFKQLLIAVVEDRGAVAQDLLEMKSEELRAQITGFCGALREAPMVLRDNVVRDMKSILK
jgi:hypothetical protein